MRCVKLVNNVMIQFNNLWKIGQLYYAVSLYFFIKIRCQIEIITVLLLGLIMCKTTIEIHGGKILVRSKSREGAVFCIRLPGSTENN